MFSAFVWHFCSFVLQIQFLFTGRSLTLLTVQILNLHVHLHYTCYVAFFLVCALPKLTGLPTDVQLMRSSFPFSENITRCFGLLSRAVNTLLIRIAWLGQLSAFNHQFAANIGSQFQLMAFYCRVGPCSPSTPFRYKVVFSSRGILVEKSPS